MDAYLYRVNPNQQIKDLLFRRQLATENLRQALNKAAEEQAKLHRINNELKELGHETPS